MMKNFLKNKDSFILFFLIAFTYLITNYLWWKSNTPIIPNGIAAVHFYDIVLIKGWLFYNAPLLTYVFKFLFFIFGTEHFDLIIIAVNYIFFLTSTYFIYKIGTFINGKETGKTAMLFFSLVPAVYGMSRFFGHRDYHVMVAMVFNIYCLLKTNCFQNRKWSFIYGLSVVIGLMIKDTFVAYFFIPFICVLFIIYKKNIIKKTLLNVFLSTSVGIILSAPHYFRYDIILKIITEPITRIAPVFQFQSIRVMTVGLWEELLSPPLFLLFLISFVWFIFKYKGIYKYLFLSWFIVPWSLIMFIQQAKLAEYGMGLIPVMIIISSIYLINIKSLYIKRFIKITIILICIFQFFILSYTDSKIFDIHFFYKNNKISYYNRYNSHLIFYNKQRRDLLVKITNYLKQNYPSRTFTIWDLFFGEVDFNENIPVDPNELTVYMILNKLNVINIRSLYNSSRVRNSDIILNIGHKKSPDELISLYLKILSVLPGLQPKFKDIINIEIENIKNNLKFIDTDCTLVDELSITGNDNKETKILFFENNKK